VAVDIFEMTSDEMRSRVQDHKDSVLAALEKVRARIARDEAEVAERPHMAGFCSSALDIYRSAAKGLETRVKEADLYLDHLPPGRTLAMSAAHLVGFAAAFGPVEVDAERTIVGAEEAVRPTNQAERAVKEALVQVPRMSLPTGIIV
jgi:hypothetical protein